MPEDALRRPAWIDEAAANGAKLCGCANIRGRLADAIEQAFEQDRLRQLLLDCRQRLALDSDAVASELVEQIDTALGE